MLFYYFQLLLSAHGLAYIKNFFLKCIILRYICIFINCIFFGGFLYVILFEILKFLLRINHFEWKKQNISISNSTKFAFFCILIIILSSLFSIQSFNSVERINQDLNNLKVGRKLNDPYYLNFHLAFSNDYKQIAYFVQQGEFLNNTFENYLVVRNLLNNDTTTYGMCGTQYFCSDILTNIDGLYFYNNSILIYRGSYSEIARYTYDLTLHNISSVFNAYNMNSIQSACCSFENEFKLINSTVYYGRMNHSANITYFTLYNDFTGLNYTIRLPSYLSNGYYFNDFTISADFTKLVIFKGNNLFFYSIQKQNNQYNATLENVLLVPNIFQFSFTSWNENQSTISFSFEGRNTYLYSYNFLNNQSSELSSLAYGSRIEYINFKNSYLVTYNPFNNYFQFYSYKNNISSLLQNTTFKDLSYNPMLNQFIGVNSTNLSLFSYNIANNSFQQRQILDSSKNSINISISLTDFTFIESFAGIIFLALPLPFIVLVISLYFDILYSKKKNTH